MQQNNVLLITIDCMGTDKLLRENLNLPFFDELKKKGVFFRNMFSSTSSTTPSIASVLTGHYPQQHGIISTYGYELSSTVKTIAEILQKENYYCSATVSGPLKPKTKISRGFDTFIYRAPQKIFKLGRFSLRFKQINSIRKGIFNSFEEVTSRQSRNWFHWIHFLDLHNRWRQDISKSNLSLYESAVEKLDRTLEQLMENVDFDNTHVLIVADHGHYVKEIDGARNGFNYDEAHGFHVYDLLTRVPFLLISPHIDLKNKEEYSNTSTIDILPTLLEMLGIENKSLPGQSLLSLIQNDKGVSQYQEKPIYLQACGAILKKQGLPNLHSIRWKNWKFVKTNDTDHFQPHLYNLTQDTQEIENVYSEHPQISQEFNDILSVYMSDKY